MGEPQGSLSKKGRARLGVAAFPVAPVRRGVFASSYFLTRVYLNDLPAVTSTGWRIS